MAVTDLGLMYAEQIHEGKRKWPSGVSKRRRQETYDSYVEMDYAPPIEPPEE